MKFDDLFKVAIGYRPYPYQTAFAQAGILLKVLYIATSVVSVETVDVGWHCRWFRAVKETEDETPHLLKFCMPVLVRLRQTFEKAVQKLTKRIGSRDLTPNGKWRLS